MFSVFFLVFYLGEKYLDENSCQTKFPNDPCKYRGSITRDQVNNVNWVNTSTLSLSGLDEFREKSQFGFRHAEFVKNSYVGSFHYDQYNALDIPFGTIAHESVFLSEKTGLADSFWLIVMFFGIFGLIYEASRHLAKL